MRATTLLLLAVTTAAFGQMPGPEHRPLELRSPVRDKTFYLLSLIENTAAVREAVAADPAMARAAKDRAAETDRASASCDVDPECNTAPFRWTDTQIEEGSRALAALYGTSKAVRNLADGPLRSSGAYVRYGQLAGPELLSRVFADSMRGINRAIDVYALGRAPRYAQVDSITYDPKSNSYRRVIHNLVAVLRDEGGFDLPFSPSLRFALELMLLNYRDEAGRFEPLEKGENAAAFRRAQSIDWSRYPYTVIAVPGSGNDRAGVRLSPAGRLRDRLAAKRFRDGKAPFILVSGGFVHPNQTEYCEAIEMKRDLMTNFGISEDAIIIDPHARHTTTNLRNAARLLFRYAIPFDRKALITTDPEQSQYISNPGFAQRAMSELGYLPFRSLERTSPFDVEFLPHQDSLHTDPTDPLDP